MGVIVKYVVEDNGQDIISSTYLPQGYEDHEAAAAHIDELRGMHDVSNFDGQHGRWWARDEAEPKRRHYWWIEYPQPAAP